ncbi:MAG: hypothetical protein A2X86_08440 [Bdellovibrionales bacterium GWA2_49_15]|nr:MAG: hypothetical protein A2X86_08440 [Bdellovibrionales bacterium GWA2_49_15]HAZ11210.1 DUF481 domain-containing protein [Bdellovibrionales bacterium]
MKYIFLFIFLTALCSTPIFAQLKNESELGIAAANGNTKTQTYNFKQMNSYPWEKNNFIFNARYLNAFANSVESARYFNANLRFERALDERFSLFITETFEKDKFAGIYQRLITDVGGKYAITKTEKTKWSAELGYRYMQEERLDGTKISQNYGRAYSEIDRQWNVNFSTKYWLEYLPNFTNSTDYQFNTELSLSVLLTNIFSLKSGFLLRYDNLPAPGIFHKTDTLLTTALVAKF